MQKAIVVFLLLFISISSIYSQKILVFDKIGFKLKRARYYEGDPFALRIFNDNVVYKGEINAISDTSFFIGNNYVEIDSIEYVVKYNKGIKNFSLLAFTVAAVTSTILVLDHAIKGEMEQVPGKLGVPAVFTAGGVALVPFWKRKYRLKENIVLKVIDLTP